MSQADKQTGPLQNLFVDIRKILDFTEFKDLAAAAEKETDLSKGLAEVWLNAQLRNDNYITYKKWWTRAMFQELTPNFQLSDFQYYYENPYRVPIQYHEILLERGRAAFLDSFEEQNDYYRTLIGLPPYGTPAEEFVYLSEELQQEYHVGNIPVHELSTYVQNKYMGTSEYAEVLVDHPEKTYLKYLGMYKVDLYAARKAYDFEIIRYPRNRSDINPNLLSAFSTLYAEYREFVMATLYNRHFEDLYENYRTFMGALIVWFTLLQIGNKALEAVHSHQYFDDTLLYMLLSMYGIPEDLILTTEVRRELAMNMGKLIREKGTNEVYYDLIEILGYHDVTVSKLMLMKGQQFDSEDHYRALDEVKPYFLQLDLRDDSPYETIASGKAPVYSYQDIVSGDPYWWDLPDVQKILHNSQYTMSASKYIVIEALIHQMASAFEPIYFSRMVLDNKEKTDLFTVEIPEIFGTEPVSIFDLILFVICATCMTNGLSGEITTENEKMMITAGFNFDLDLDAFLEYLNTTKYVAKDRLLRYLENLTVTSMSDLNRLYSDVLYPMRQWLEDKVAAATEREEYLEYESIYRALFTYDLTRNKFLDDFEKPIEVIRKKYGLTEEEMLAFRHFYPRTMTGNAVTVSQFNGGANTSRYRYPFLSLTDQVDWYIHIVVESAGREDDRGYLYFHDILNCDDLRELTNPDGTRVFMDYKDQEVGWEINQQAVDQAISLLKKLDEEDLNNAHFQIYTPVLNGETDQHFDEGERLPAILRTGVYKEILIDKVNMDMNGLAVPPNSYFEFLYRKNYRLYHLLLDPEQDRFHRNQDAWMNDVMTIVLALEKNIGIHMKYFEQSILGKDLFFKPLVTLIKHFKSSLVEIAKTNLRYIFDDKMDIGGNSNMFKFFDVVRFIVHFSTIAGSGYESQFGFYDVLRRMTHHIEFSDRSELYNGVDDYGRPQSIRMGSMHLTDEVKLFRRGTSLDPDGQAAHWRSGESGTGRWEDEDDFLMRTRTGTAKVHNQPVDLEGWKDFVESYSPIE